MKSYRGLIGTLIISGVAMIVLGLKWITSAGSSLGAVAGLMVALCGVANLFFASRK